MSIDIGNLMAKSMPTLLSDLNSCVKCKQQSGFTFSDCAMNIKTSLLTGEKSNDPAVFNIKPSLRALLSFITLQQYFCCLQPFLNTQGNSPGKDSKLRLLSHCICCRRANALSKHMQDGLGNQWAAVEVICFASSKTDKL